MATRYDPSFDDDKGALTKLIKQYSSFSEDDLRCGCPDELFVHLSQRSVYFERNLAICLGLGQYDIQQIGKDLNTRQTEKVIAMFWKWKELQKEKATYLTLIKALEKDQNISAVIEVLSFFKEQPKDHVPNILTTPQEKEERIDRPYHSQMSYPPERMSSYAPPPSRSLSFPRGTQQNKDQSVCAKKPDNDGWKIVDKYYEELVKVLRLDEELCHQLLRSLDEYLLIDQSDREMIEGLPCVEIKSKAIMKHVSARISGARNHIGILGKFVFALEKIDKLKRFNDEMIADASLYNIYLKRTGPRRQTTCPSIQEISDTPCTSANTYDADIETVAIKKYSRQLKSIYRCCLKPDSKWSPDSSSFKIFVDLAVIQSNARLGSDVFSKSTIHYTLDDIMLQKKPLSFDELCNIPYESIVLIEGAPGIGKSMLAYEMCQQWAKGKYLTDYVLLLLLRLRDENIQKITSVEEFLGCFLEGQSWKKDAIQDIIDNSGKGVLIILEGYDELPEYISNRKSIFTDIAEKLPFASKIYTSRPSMRHFLTNELRFSIHVEVLGFTAASVTKYTAKFFKDDHSLIERFENCLEKSPKVKSCLYIPIYLTIVCSIFVDENHIPIEGNVTSTKLYEALIKMLLYRQLKTKYPGQLAYIESLRSLPSSIMGDFQKLCQYAYSGLRNLDKTTKLTFVIPEDLDTLGLMQKEVQVLPCYGDVVVYSFLHLTMQEFLAALHITLEIPRRIQMHFDRYLNVKNLFTMLHFLAGLTKLESYSLKTQDNFHNLNIFQFLFESDNIDLMKRLFSNPYTTHKVSRILPRATPHDMFILGKCIALSQCKWELSFTLRGMLSEHLEQFRLGLSSVQPSSSHSIKDISFKLNEIGNSGLVQLLWFPGHILGQLISLRLMCTNLNKGCIPDFVANLPKLAQLETLILNNNKFKEGEQLPLLQALHQISINDIYLSKLSPLECKVLLTKIPSLTIVHLYQLSPPSIAAVLEHIPKLPSLEEVHLEQSFCTPEILPTYLPLGALTHLKSIQFVNCAIDSNSVPSLLKAIKEAHLLKRVSLEDNYIDDEAGHMLCDMIHSNLVELDVRHNLFTSKTVLGFVRELTLVKGNHILYLSSRWKSFLEESSSYPIIKDHIKFQKQ